jgi:group II intron reverse transcriptase/maturase
MMEACDVLNIIREKNRKHPDWMNRGLYRLLYNPTLHIMAYERLKSKPGNMTPGTEGETLDGYSLDDIEKNIDLLRQEKYQPKPVRRTHIPKKGGYRPLGMPSPRDKIIQECVRLILEVIYEPQFHDNSHGFRPGRSCHTALESMRRNWVGTKWAIKADITACFEQIDHNYLLDILRERIEDDRFINLIRRFLKAGYMENWEYHKTYSGTPQGSVVSPILTNIHLDKLDQKLAEMCQQYSQGKYRRRNPAHIHLMQQRKRLLEQGEADPTIRASLKEPIRQLNHQILATPAAKYNDPAYTRVKFLRYADDVAIGVIGPKSLARQIVDEIATHLKEELKLELNRDKTQIYYLLTEPAPFLGYLVKTATPRFRRRTMNRTKRSSYNVAQTTRTTTGNIKLLVPLREIKQKLKRYMQKGQPAKMNGLVYQPIGHIIDHYNGVIRGWYNYYQLAENVGRLNYARYVLRFSLAKTLAAKERSTLNKIFRKYGQSITYTKPNGKQLQFFSQPMKQVKKAKPTTRNIDQCPIWWPRKTKSRLLDNCAICSYSGRIEMHHVRHIRKRGQQVKGFKLYLAAINRKQIPVCRRCHQAIHKGKYDGPNLSSIVEKIELARTKRGGVSS